MGEIDEHILRQPRGQILWSVFMVERVGIGLAVLYRKGRRASEPGVLEGRSKYGSLAPRGELSGVSAGVQGTTSRTLYEPVQLSESLALTTSAPVFVFVAWRMVAAVL